MINDVLKTLTWIFYIMAALGAVVSIFIFFKLRIIEVIQDLNGTLAQKQIEQMRKRTMKNDGGNVAQELFDKGLGETGNIGNTGNTGNVNKRKATQLTQTGNLNENKPVSTGFRLGSLQNQMQMGSVQNGTTVLRSNTSYDSEFVMVKNIVYINTSEFI